MEKNQPLIPGTIADYHYGDDGILYSYSKSILRTVENISENVALVKEITGGRRVPLLIYISNSPVPDKAARKFSTEQLPVIYTAMAMVSEKWLAKLIMNVLFKFQQPPIPMKSFTNDADAKDWLKQYV
ncbi:MAG: hypothetical protein K0S09_1127 [Sphingobacteriaceae bacterium]|jgi:hypothetical protein|nr:hypothetical protein [Sphingobacteriaceae bacterium]